MTFNGYPFPFFTRLFLMMVMEYVNGQNSTTSIIKSCVKNMVRKQDTRQITSPELEIDDRPRVKTFPRPITSRFWPFHFVLPTHSVDLPPLHNTNQHCHRLDFPRHPVSQTAKNVLWDKSTQSAIKQPSPHFIRHLVAKHCLNCSRPSHREPLSSLHTAGSTCSSRADITD